MRKPFLLFSIIAFYICFSNVSFSAAFAEKYNHNELSLEIPVGWVKIKTLYMEAVEAVFTKKFDDDIEITPIMVIAIGDNVVGLTINDVVENAVKTVTSAIPEAKFLFERDIHTGNVRWREIIYQYSDAGYSFQVVQYHTINNKKHYAFTGQCLQKHFREHLPDFRKTFNTWKFKTD